MEQQEATVKKKKQRSKAGTILLIVFLLLAATVGFLFYSVFFAPVKPDDPQKLAAAAPMSAAERFRFSAADQTVQIKVDAADLWSLVLTYAGEDYLELINRELSAYSLSVSGCSIQIKEKGPYLKLELFYKDTRLTAKLPFTLEASGQHFCLKPAGVNLGVIPLPVEELLSSVKLEFDMKLPLISNVTAVGYEKDAILITGIMEEDIRALAQPEKKLYQTAIFNEPMQPLADALIKEESYGAMLSYLEQDPGSIEALYRDLFTLAGLDRTTDYLNRHRGLVQRLLPGVDYTTIEGAHTELNEQMEPLCAILERFFASVVSDYTGKDFQLSDGQFLRKLKPFHPDNYGNGLYDTMFEVLDPDTFFLVLVDAEDGFTDKTPAFNELADENLQFTQPVDYSRIYVLGCVFRSLDGDPFLIYETEIKVGQTRSRGFKLLPLTEDAVSTLQVPGKFGVWRNKT